MRNIVLTGFMGTGKSSVGRRLARELGLKFLDMDGLIEEEAGCSVKEIFRAQGEDRFRQLERRVIEKLAAGGFGDGVVVSTGGGAVVNTDNRRLLKSWGAIVCLTAEPDVILKRVGDRDDRPLLARDDKREAVLMLLEERKEAYRDCDFSVDTSGIDIRTVVGKIREFLEKQL